MLKNYKELHVWQKAYQHQNENWGNRKNAKSVNQVPGKQRLESLTPGILGPFSWIMPARNGPGFGCSHRRKIQLIQIRELCGAITYTPEISKEPSKLPERGPKFQSELPSIPLGTALQPTCLKTGMISEQSRIYWATRICARQWSIPMLSVRIDMVLRVR